MLMHPATTTLKDILGGTVMTSESDSACSHRLRAEKDFFNEFRHGYNVLYLFGPEQGSRKEYIMAFYENDCWVILASENKDYRIFNSADEGLMLAKQRGVTQIRVCP